MKYITFVVVVLGLLGGIPLIRWYEEASKPIVIVQEVEAKEQAEVVTAVVVEEAKLYPQLKRICSCESNGNPDGEPRQFNDDGSVLLGKVNSHDVGQCQISETYWLDEANKLGYDIYTSDGNIRMANYIYEKHGAKPWFWSLPCHGVR